jgi:hypothetical protein
MANEIQVTAKLSYTNAAKNIANQFLQIPNGVGSFNITGQNYSAGTKSFPTTAGGTAIPLGGVGTLGWAMFLNLDSTNYVQILNAASGTVLIRLNAGEIALFRFDAGVTAPVILANTAAVEVQWLILET